MRAFHSVFVPACFLVSLAAACGSTTDNTTSSASTTSTSTSTSSGQGGSTSSSSSGTGGMEPGTTTVSASIGPVHIMPYQEDVQCVVVSLKNAEGAFARKFRTTLETGSHHMIVYRSKETVEDLTPKPCNSFEGILKGEHPVFIAQQAHSELVFPKDTDGTPVGLELSANQMFKIEMHFINTTAAPLDVTGTAEIDVLPLTSKVVKSDLAFWGTTKIDIPAQGEGDTGVLFQAALPNTNVFALTTHQHHLGTEMRVWYANDKNDLSRTVADGKSWGDPPLEVFDPPLAFGAAGTKGFAFECHWKNPSANSVHFGEGFNDEMCFLWHYYYPSMGFQICYVGQGCLESP